MRRAAVASNFRILVHRNDDNLHLKLAGDLDGASARALTRTLARHRRGASSAFIHTNGLDRVFPAARDDLKRRLETIQAGGLSLVLTGDLADELAPDGARRG
jgi:anti-anti-sigma regulatory factor